jgi:hypothetical protein
MADKKASDAAQALLKSFQETNQVITENMAATQERSKQFAQSFFTEGMGVLKANQAVAQSIVAAQERNMKFFQGLLR